MGEVVLAHVAVARKDRKVAGHSVRRKHFKIKGTVFLNGCDFVLAELRQVQQRLFGRDRLVAAVELVQHQVFQLGCAGQEAKVHVAEFQTEVPELGGQVHRLVVERARASDPCVRVQNGRAQVLGDALLALEDGSDLVALGEEGSEHIPGEDVPLVLWSQ